MRHKSNLPQSFRYAGFLLLAFLFALTNMWVPASMTEPTVVNIKNFGKVNENYYRGSQPGPAEFAELKKLGIKTVIDLRKDSVPGEPLWVSSAGMKYFNIPLKASRPATEEQTTYFLSLVNDPANWPVYVHCKGGRHRTGALTGVYRITHDGWTAEQAYSEMKKYDFEDGFFGGPTAQKKYVYAFYERHAAKSSQK